MNAGSARDRRERQWRITHPRLSVRIGTGGDVVVRQQIERLAVEREMQAILDYSRRPDGASPEWQHKAGIVTMMAVLSPDDAAAIKEEWIALLAPESRWRHRAVAPAHDRENTAAGRGA